MKIYTKTGDDGTTSLFGGARVRKYHRRIDAYGTVDELNSLIGLTRTLRPAERIDTMLAELQNDLFMLGADMATPLEKKASVPRVAESDVQRLEAWIDECDEQLAPLTCFILPGGTPVAAQLHVCRTVCRRAERLTVEIGDGEAINPLDIQYLNRLSDLLFVLARLANAGEHTPDVPWKQR